MHTHARTHAYTHATHTQKQTHQSSPPLPLLKTKKTQDKTLLNVDLYYKKKKKKRKEKVRKKTADKKRKKKKNQKQANKQTRVG